MSRQPTALEAALERLSAAPFEEFTATRDALAREAKAAGDAGLAAQLKKERRPPVTAWALDQLARRRPDLVEALLESGERMRQAQRRAVGGEGAGPLRDATAEQRQALSALLKEALAVVREAGSAGSADQHDRMEGTLLACANGPEALGRLLREAKLDRDLPRPGFGDLGGLEAPAAAPAPAPAPAREGAEGREHERQQREHERLRKDAEHRAQHAQRALAEARRRRERAEDAARRAAEALQEATAQAERAREALAAAEGELSSAEAEAAAADQALAMLR